MINAVGMASVGRDVLEDITNKHRQLDASKASSNESNASEQKKKRLSEASHQHPFPAPTTVYEPILHLGVLLLKSHKHFNSQCIGIVDFSVCSREDLSAHCPSCSTL